MHSLEVGEKRWVLRRDGRVGGWLRGGGGHGAVGPVRDDHPPHTTLRHPSLAPRRTSIVHSGFVAFLAALLQALPPCRTSLGAATRFFRRAAAGLGGLTREIYYWFFATFSRRTSFTETFSARDDFPAAAKKGPREWPPTIEIPCYFLCPAHPPLFSRSPRSIEDTRCLKKVQLCGAGVTIGQSNQASGRLRPERERARGASEKTR